MRARKLEPFLREWRRTLERERARLRADQLYLGRGFQEARMARDLGGEAGYDARLFIVSAGLGLVADAQLAPAYSITAARSGADSALKLLGLSDPAEWWDALTHGRRGLAARFADADLVVVALSAPYIAMLRHDLVDVVRRFPDRLRLIARRDPSPIDPALGSVWMPYDNRLNGAKSPIPGAESDFAQRALRHFVSVVLKANVDASAAQHRRAVEKVLAPLSRPRRRHRQKATDEEIIILMRRIGADVGAGRMLRVMRDDKNIACEQSRASALFKKAFAKERKASAR